MYETCCELLNTGNERIEPARSRESMNDVLKEEINTLAELEQLVDAIISIMYSKLPDDAIDKDVCCMNDAIISVRDRTRRILCKVADIKAGL